MAELFKPPTAIQPRSSTDYPRLPLRAPATRRAAPGLNPSFGWGLTFCIPLVVLAAVSAPAWAGQAPLPEGVPNLFDADVRSQFEPVAMVNLRGDADFPVLLLVNKTADQPQAMVVGLDARNGKDTWSLASDPIILIMLFSDPSTISAVHMDAGFSEQGKPSGAYRAMEDPGSLTLPDVFRAIAAAPVRTYM